MVVFAGVDLSGRSISYGSEQYRSVIGAHARVETVGEVDRRVTATRLVLTGPLAFGLRKKKDRRQVFLTIEGEDFAWAIEVKPKSLSAAYQFAAEVNAAGKQPQMTRHLVESEASERQNRFDFVIGQNPRDDAHAKLVTCPEGHEHHPSWRYCPVCGPPPGHPDQELAV